MDKAKSLSITGLLFGSFALTRHVGSSFAYDKPVHTSILLLASAAVTVLAGSRLLRKEDTRISKRQQYDALPLSEVGRPHASREPSPEREDVRYPSSLRKLRICLFVLVCAVCARVAVFRYILENIQCTALSWEPLIPLAFAAYDYWTTTRYERKAVYDDPNGSIYDEALDSYVGRSPYRYVYAGALLGIGSMIGLSTSSSPTSTYVCASTLSNHWLVPFVQHLSTMLDIAMLYCMMKLLEGQNSDHARSPSLRVASIGWALLVSAVAILACGTIYTAFLTTPIQRKRIFEIPPYYVWSLLRLNALFCFTLLSACLAILSLGLMNTVFTATFVSVYTHTTASAWDGSPAFPPPRAGWGLLGFCMILVGFAAYFFFDAASSNAAQLSKRLFTERLPIWVWLTLTTLFVVRASLWASSSSSVNYHPIDLMLYDAQIAHEAYINQTSASQSLAAAARTYRERYGKHPPPGFEHWYKYATDRNSIVIDHFDTINDDLRPFWAVSPEQIRERTWQMISNPWHDASGLSIRNGKVEMTPSKFVMPTHAWMLEGLVKMIGNFAEWLPDMDLAFNVNDECRVAVPFEVIEEMRRRAGSTSEFEAHVENSFSADRAQGWAPLPDEPNNDRVMREMSWQNIFNEFGNAACPPSSPARTQRQVDVGHFCTSCTAPHSLGAFLSNWTLAHDVCHQPDVARLHGIYAAPAAFKASHDLFPIFSQSKVSGFNDILYPSAWNYIDKASYEPTSDFPDPPFPEKNSTLFWRGATSEGFSSGAGQWKGMARQRFAHLVNAASSVETQALLVPYTSPSGAQKLRYRNLPLSQLSRLLPTDVHIASSVARCGGNDCKQQAAEFAPLVPATDFQAHWGYKYLLDLDGAGFSGRFLPFLTSRSLPFKAAVFREWWDDRVTPWKHFVPLDVRGQGLWGTLAYFAGVGGGDDTEKESRGELVVPGHEREAERIAEAGREWAGRVLRKEDMEVYFFRLLLEWGRLTDDRRGEIGFGG